MTRSHVDFVGRRRTWALVSLSILVLSIGGLLVRGLALSIDFEGGTSFLLHDATASIEAGDLRDAAEAAGGADVKAQIRTAADGSVGALVQVATFEGDAEAQQAHQDEISAALVEAAGTDDLEIKFVGPTWGRRISGKALEALLVFLIVVVAYITLRLEAKMAVAAVVALVHDVVITVGAYSLVGFTVSPSTVIALLTILGYSLYDTVVVFDRVKETGEFLGQVDGHRTVDEHVNTSLNEVLWRSINTSMTSLIPVGSLLFVGSRVLGASTLSDLALALFIGMAAGTYSSIFVAGPFFSWWKSREDESQRLVAKQKARLEFQAAAAAAKSGESGTADRAATKPAAASAEPGQPVTTDYVRGQGRRKRRKR